MAKKQSAPKADEVEIDLEPLNNELPEDEIQVVDADAEPEEIETKAEQKQEIPIDDGINELKLKLEAEKAAREEAERRARESAAVAQNAKIEVDDSNLRLIDTAIETVKANNINLKEKLKEALRSGDVDAAADIQEMMGTNAAKLLQLENGKNAYKSRMQEAPRQAADPVEALASQLTPRSAAWVRANPQFARDPNLYQKMVAAHNIAMADGIPPDTDEYFEAVESTLKINRKPAVEAADEPISDAGAPKQRRSAPPAAPVSRQAPNNSGSRPNVVRLTAAEREMASMMGMTDAEYAKNKLALMKEGKLH